MNIYDIFGLLHNIVKWLKLSWGSGKISCSNQGDCGFVLHYFFC